MALILINYDRANCYPIIWNYVIFRKISRLSVVISAWLEINLETWRSSIEIDQLKEVSEQLDEFKSLRTKKLIIKKFGDHNESFENWRADLKIRKSGP